MSRFESVCWRRRYTFVLPYFADAGSKEMRHPGWVSKKKNRKRGQTTLSWERPANGVGNIDILSRRA